MAAPTKKGQKPGRSSTMQVAALNIRVHPHRTPLIYVDLLKDAYALKRSVSVLGDHHIQMSGGVRELTTDKPLEGVCGELAKFTNIDSTKPFYDIETEREADESQLQGVERFDRVKPNYTSFEYIFYPLSHLLLFEVKVGTKNLSPNLVEKFFQKLFSHPNIIKKYGRVDLTVIPKAEKLEEIKALKLKKGAAYGLQRKHGHWQK